MSQEAAKQEAAKLIEAAAAQNGNGRPDPISAREELVEILSLESVGLTITGARIVGRGGGASADLYLSDGSALTFERLRDAGKPGVLAIEVAACTGATPKMNGAQALRVVSLMRALAEHETAFDGDQVAREWGTSFLQEATVVDLDMADQAQRWQAFLELAAIDPASRRAAGEATSIASACRVLRHENGTRYVRTGWFRARASSSGPSTRCPLGGNQRARTRARCRSERRCIYKSRARQPQALARRTVHLRSPHGGVHLRSPEWGDLGMSAGLSLELPDELLDAITERVVARLETTSSEPAGYLDVSGAAEFLSCPPSRIYPLVSSDRIPHHRDGSRLLFDRGELREYVNNGGARRP